MKLCLIYNFAQHYRTSIFTLMDKEFDMDFCLEILWGT